jgi:hypothetical protein
MKPLRREWREVQQLVANLLATGKKHPKDADREKPPPTGRKLKQARGEAQIFLRRFHQDLARVHVLDPACGSGSWLRGNGWRVEQQRRSFARVLRCRGHQPRKGVGTKYSPATMGDS